MKKKKRSIFLYLAAAVLLSVMLFSAYRIIEIQKGYKAGRDEYSAIEEQTVVRPQHDGSSGQSGTEQGDNGLLTVDTDQLRILNPDFVFWIDLPDTGISYPVVQGQDNDYYLRRTFAGNYSVGGVIFMDYRCSDELLGLNTIIYGHRMNDGSMFSGLRNFVKQDYADLHPSFYLYTGDAVYCYEIFSCRRTDVTDSCYNIYFSTDAEYMDWLTSQKALSAVDTGTVPVLEDRVVTLSTCAGGEDEDARYVVQGVLRSVKKNP